MVAEVVTHVVPLVASASLPSGGTTIDGVDITTATNTIFDVVSAVLAEIIANPVFLIFFVSGLVFMGVRIIRALKRI